MRLGNPRPLCCTRFQPPRFQVGTPRVGSHVPAAVGHESVSTQFWHALHAAPNNLDAVVYFGHGTPTTLVSIEIGRHALPTFADRIRTKCRPGVTVVLYACLAGDWQSLRTASR